MAAPEPVVLLVREPREALEHAHRPVARRVLKRFTRDRPVVGQRKHELRKWGLRLVDLERPNVALFEDRPVGPVDVRRIVPIDEPEDEHLEEAQLALETAEVHPDEHANLAWVPADAKLDTPAYHRVLSERLRPIQGRDQAVAALRQLRAELEAGTIPH